jgi:uncharacterized protein YukE
MSTTLKINTLHLNRDAREVESCICKMQQETAKLKTSMSQLCGMWEGKGSKVFQAALQDDVQALEQVLKNLKKLHSYETYGRQEYESCGQKVEALVEELEIGG